MKRPTLGIIAAGAVALLLAGCASTSSGPSSGSTESSKDPIKVAVFFGETGASASYAKVFYAGINSAVESINAAGGVNGRKIVTSFQDDGTDPTKVVSLITEATTSGDMPDAIFPGSSSGEALAALPLLTSKKIFSVSTATSPLTNDQSKYPYHFGVSALQAEGLKVLAGEFKAKGIKTLSVVTSADAFGDSILAGITAVAQKAGVKIIGTERPAANALDYTVELQRVKAAKPDAIFFDMAIPASSGLILTARDIVGATDIPIYGGTATAATPVGGLVDKSATANCSIPVYTFTVKGKAEKHLDPYLKAFEKVNTGSLYFGGEGWDVIQVVAAAFRNADGATGAPDLKAALEAKGIAAHSLALFPAGTTYSDKNHFSTVTDGSLSLIPCNSTQTGGFWVASS